MNESVLEKVAQFPSSPGVYLMKDALGRVIYVGKAKDLRKRVLCYFQERPRASGSASASGGGDGGEVRMAAPRYDGRYQVKFLMAKVHDVDIIVTAHEREAFHLENTLIKKHAPRYNIQLKDDKSYLSIKLSMKDQVPRIYVTRRIVKDGALYFGPYSSAYACRKTVDFIERHFRLRTCSDHELSNRVRPCLQYQIGRCEAPCVGLIAAADYREQAQQVKLFLQGKNQDLIKRVEQQMQQEAGQEQFEKAARSRDLVMALRETLAQQSTAKHHWLDQDVIHYYREGERMTVCVVLIREGKVWDSRLYHLKGHQDDTEILESFLGQFYGEDRFIPDEILLPQGVPESDTLTGIFSEKRGKKTVLLVPQRGDRVDLLRLARSNAEQGFRQRQEKKEEISEILEKLQETLGLQNFPRRMECFDISNTQGEQSVGSLVSFLDGEADKSHYKRFKIKTVTGPDDFASMREVLKRRLSHIQAAEVPAKWEKPDLMVIDGGKGQLSAVQAIMEELNVTGIDLISLAKAREGEVGDKVFLPGRMNPVRFAKNSSLLHLLMQIRDEAHRFAITYHRKLRAKAFLPSA